MNSGSWVGFGWVLFLCKNSNFLIIFSDWHWW